MPKSKSSQNITLALPQDVVNILRRAATESGTGIQHLIRAATYEWLERHGLLVSTVYNPEGRGVRSDLRTRTPAEERALDKELKERFSKKPNH